MPYLADNKISTSQLPDGIVITDLEYAQALEALAAGRRVCPRDGKMLIYSGQQRTVYSVEDGEAMDIPREDSIPAGYTSEPKPAHHSWDGERWVLDAAGLAAELRIERNAELSGTDHVVIRAIERGESVAEVWQAYRQALRDLPAQEGFPDSVQWPHRPGA